MQSTKRVQNIRSHVTASPAAAGERVSMYATFTCDPTQRIKRYIGDGTADGLDGRPATTLPQQFDLKIAQHGNLAALRTKREKTDADWTTWTWAQYQSEVHRAARAMIALGLEPHDSINIMRTTRQSGTLRRWVQSTPLA